MIVLSMATYDCENLDIEEKDEQRLLVFEMAWPT